MTERRKRITASNVGSIAKMRKTTERCNKVKNLLYSSFGEIRQLSTVLTTKSRHGSSVLLTCWWNHSLEVRECGLFISKPAPWLAASPDGVIYDRSNPNHIIGPLEIKCPHSAKDISIDDACSIWNAIGDKIQ